MKKKSTILLVLALLTGLSLILYPSVSDYWNSLFQSRSVAVYSEQLANMSNEEFEALFEEANKYNQSLLDRTNKYGLTDEQKEAYPNMLKLSDSDVIAYVEIPSINVTLPVYHGTDEAILQIAVGHLDWTSLPVGGESTHAVLSGHRGLPSAKLFTDLDDLVAGDIFMIQVLNQTLTYEVDQILIVEPDQVTDLVIQEGMDLCTLVTCTPYAINSHRLLVRGHRIANREEAIMVPVTSEVTQIKPVIVACVTSIVILLILMLMVLLKKDDATETPKKKVEKKSLFRKKR